MSPGAVQIGLAGRCASSSRRREDEDARRSRGPHRRGNVFGRAGPGTARTGPVRAVSQTSVLGPADRDLLVRVQLAGLWEQLAGFAAPQRGHDDLVKDDLVRNVGEKIANEHHELDELVRRVAVQLGVELPDEPTAEQQGWLAEMATAQGVEFDRVFVGRLRAAHGKIFPVIVDVRASSRNAPMRAFAATDLGVALPDLPNADQPNADQRRWLTEITTAQGEYFDRVFIERLRAADGDVFPVIAAVRSGTRNDLIRGFAATANDTVLRHMKYLEDSGLVDYGVLPRPAAPAGIRTATFDRDGGGVPDRDLARSSESRPRRRGGDGPIGPVPLAAGVLARTPMRQ
jgi:Domain of unknown function (DUF4142)